jgi:hypothetical protein
MDAGALNVAKAIKRVVRSKMSVTTKLKTVIKSSRQRMQAGQSPSVVKSAPKTGAINSGSTEDKKRCST